MNILYHYCSNDSFLSIIQSKSIWLSSLSLSNDSSEGKLVDKLLSDLAKEEDLEQREINEISEHISLLHSVIDGLGFCLSKEGDLLSQWRGYASDGAGVSIGFSKDYIQKLADFDDGSDSHKFTLRKIEYDPKIQKKLLRPDFDKLKKLIDQGVFKPPRSILASAVQSEERAEEEQAKDALQKKFNAAILLLIGKLYLLKNKAFKEEAEWRLISLFIKDGLDASLFRATNSGIIPYRSFELVELGENPIVKVVLGPKNKTPEYVIENLLKSNGFKSTEIEISKATYR